MEVLSILASSGVKISSFLSQEVEVCQLSRSSTHRSNLEQLSISSIVELKDNSIISFIEVRSSEDSHMTEIDASTPPYIVSISSQIRQ